MPIAHLAIDLGASSGRAIVGVLDGTPTQLRLEEVHRFEHLACPTPAGPVWDLTGIWHNILTGLTNASAWCKDNSIELRSIGVDTWGVDWTLVGSSGELLGLPHCYRDPQNEAACQQVLDKVGGFGSLYEQTGIQLLPFNTIFQIAARHEREPGLFDAAKRLVFLPDLFHYWLSGELATERTIASTSGMLDVETGEWSTSLLGQLALPTEILGPIVEPGSSVGSLRTEVATATGASTELRVVVPASHDTASAVAAVPATEKNGWAYLSSGTWSLLGAELHHPIYSEEAQKVPFTNERGVCGTVRLLKNIAGLWLLQELRRELDQKDFSQLVEEARAAEPRRTLVDPNYAEFASPGNMADKIRQFARSTNQPEPKSVGQLVRCCLESLALSYSHTVGELEAVLGEPIDRIHMVGGGIRNALLNEFTASSTGKSVIAGPVEATAAGNLLVQAMGCGELAGIAEIREVVVNSFELTTVEGADAEAWDEPRDRFAELIRL